MIAAVWTLRYKKVGGTAVEKSFADWGLGPPRMTFTNQAKDTATFTALAHDVDAADLFDLGPTGIEHQITIKRDGVAVFCGTVAKQPKKGSSKQEEQTFEVQGPWYFLEETTYEQQWETGDPDTDTLGLQYRSHLVLGQDIQLSPFAILSITVGQQIANIINFAKQVVDGTLNDPVAATAGYTIQVDTTNMPTVYPPWIEEQEVTCANAIKRMLYFAPDAVCWWDYSTTSGGECAPTFHCVRRPSLVSKTVSLASLANAETLQLSSREDLFRQVVIVKWEYTVTINGQSITALHVDKWPTNGPNFGVKAWVATVNLAGPSFASASITTAAISETDPNWWKGKDAALNDPSITGPIVIGNTHRSSTYPNELTQGQIAQWMPVNKESDVVTAEATFTNASGKKTITLRAPITATNATTGTYTVIERFGQPIPTGVAQALYEAVNTLHYEGTVDLLEEEWSGSIGLGNVLNITGGDSRWATMNAFIWQVVVDAQEGRSSLTVGPTAILGPGDLATLLMASRFIHNLSVPNVRASGQSGMQIQLGDTVANSFSNNGTKSYEVLTIGGNDLQGNDRGTVTIDRALAVGRPMSIKERWFPTTLNGVEVLRKALVISSEFYD